MEAINKRLALLLESLCRSECEDREQPNAAARNPAGAAAFRRKQGRFSVWGRPHAPLPSVV